MSKGSVKYLRIRLTNTCTYYVAKSINIQFFTVFKLTKSIIYDEKNNNNSLIINKFECTMLIIPIILILVSIFYIVYML